MFPGDTPENRTPQVRLNAAPLSPAANEGEFLLHQAAVEWSLIEPIVITGEDDIRSRVNWRERLQPFHHQIQNLITFCRRLPVSIIADDVGLGKTISAGLILSELLIRRKVNRALVVCTGLIGPQWLEELESKFGIDGKIAAGNGAPTVFSGDSTVVITTYDTLRVHFEHARNAGFEMLILDEAHKLRNLHGTPNPPQIAQRIRMMLEQRLFKYVLMLTATPMQNRIFDLYSLVDCLAAAKGHANPFGDPRTFSRRFAFGEKSRGWATTPAGIEFRSILRQYLVRTRREVARLHFPSRLVYLRRVEQSPIDREILQIVRDEVASQGLSGGNTLRQLGMAMMSSPQALLQSLQTNAGGNPARSTAITRVQQLLQLSPVPSKMQAVMQIIEELREQRPSDWRMVIFTARLPTLETIVHHLQRQGINTGVIRGQDPIRNQATIRNYSASPPTCNVIVSTDAGAEGVNLQKGNVVVNYDLPWNPMTIEQRIGRVQRLGSEHATVLIFSLAVADSPEDHVVAKLLTKLIEISESVGDIESILEVSDRRDQHDFESQIAHMVQQSIRGVDVLEQSRQAEDSISRARALLARQQDELNERLGDLSELHGAGVRPPNLTRLDPKQPFRQFVTAALQYAGNAVTEAPEYGEEVLQVRCVGQRLPALITFSRDVCRQLKRQILNATVQLYQPGQQVYERLLETWRNRGACKIQAVWKETEALTKGILKTYADQIIGAEITAAKISGKQRHFAGKLTVLARASNGVDRYEKLIDVEVRPREHTPINTERIFTADLEGGEQSPTVHPFVPERIQHAVRTDSDFESFQAFYRSRLQEELPRAGSEPHLQKKVLDDFTVSLEADVRSVEGLQYETCRVKLELAINGHAGYEVTLHLVPASGQILSEPVLWETCDTCGNEYPTEFLDTCEYSAKRVLRHLLAVSDESGRRVLSDYLQRCEHTGRLAVVDEFAASSLTGLRVARSALRQSPIGNRLYLEGEMLKCQFTDVMVGLDQVKISNVSGRITRNDQLATCEITGKCGHYSEFVRCEESEQTVLPEQTEISCVSSRRVLRSLLLPSAKPPGRLGLRREFVTCAESGLRLLTDEVQECTACALPIDRELLVCCPESKRWLLPRLRVRCHVSGLLVWSGVTVKCSVTGENVLQRLSCTSGLSGRVATAEYFVTCTATGILLLPDERFISDISKQIFRSDHKVTSTSSGRQCNQSESVQCGFSDRRLLPDETLLSDCSGRILHRSEAVFSDESGRAGHVSESFCCPETSLRLLEDEGEQCAVTGQRVSLTAISRCTLTNLPAIGRLLVRCDFTQRLALPSRLVISQESGKRFLDDQTFLSEETGRTGHLSECVTCRHSGRKLFPSELTTCEISGELCAFSACELSPASGKRALSRYFGFCQYTHGRFLQTELAQSAVTGSLFRSDQSVTSVETGRIGHQSEAIECELTGLPVLKDETILTVSGYRCLPRLTETCVISGRLELKCWLGSSEFSDRRCRSEFLLLCRSSGMLMCPDESGASQYSQRIAHTSQLLLCAESQLRIFRSEGMDCAISGKFVLKKLCRQSVESGDWALSRLMSQCAWTGDWLLPTETQTSAVTGRILRSSAGITSELSGRIGHISESLTCQLSQAVLLSDEAGQCSVSGKTCQLQFLHPCAVTGRLALECYLFQSEFSDARALAEHLITSAVSGRRMLKTEATYSKLTEAAAHPTELMRCEETGRYLLPAELTQCMLTGRQSGVDLCGVSAISGRHALKKLLRQCEFTGSSLFPDELLRSEVSGKLFRVDQRFVSPYTHRVGHCTEAVECAISAKRLLCDEAAKCDESGLICDPRLLVICAVTGRRVLQKYTSKSDFSHLHALSCETLVSDVSKLRMLKTESMQSAFSGKIAHHSEIVRCQYSDAVLLPDEAVECSVTGKRVMSTLCQRSAISGQPALAIHMRICEITQVPVLPTELTQSAVSGRWFRSDKAMVSGESGTVAHKSEMVRCHFSDCVLLQTEAIRSDFSGHWMSKRVVQTSISSGRLGHKSEFVTCEVSGKQLLSDETDWCESSGRQVDRTLLLQCPLSSVRALKSELNWCEKSGRHLHASEIVTTPVLEKRVGRDLLVKSDFSGQLALPEELRRCVLTGRRGLPDEGVTCAETGLWMAPHIAEKCSKSKSFYRPGICIRSAKSSELVHPSKALPHGVTKERMHPADARFCHWYGYFLRSAETSRCLRTKLHFESTLLDPEGVFGPFAQLMRRERDVAIRADLIPILQQLEPIRLKRLHALYVMTRSSRAKTLYCRAHVHSRFRLDVYFIGFVLRTQNDGLRIISPLTRELTDGRWEEYTG
jgi:superfamily II DNA or RNA helicase